MARYNQTAIFESSRKASRELCAAVDAHEGNFFDQNDQDGFLQDLIRTKGLQKTSATAQVDHTVASLRAHLSNQVKKHKKDKSRTNDDFWRLGSGFFTEKYLNTIGFVSTGGEVGGPEPSSVKKTAVSNSNAVTSPFVRETPSPDREGTIKKRQREEDETEAQERPGKLTRTDQHHVSDIPISVGPSRKRSAAEAELSVSSKDVENSKRIRITSDSSLSSVDSAQFAGSTMPSQKQVPVLKVATVSTSAAPAEPQPMQQAGLITGPGHETRRHDSGLNASQGATKETESDSPGETAKRASSRPSAAQAMQDARAPSANDLLQARHKAPLKGLRQRHQAKIGDIYPPEIPDMAENQMYGFRLERGQIGGKIREVMETLFYDSREFLDYYCEQEGLESSGPAHFVQQPSPELEALYQKIMGSKQWNTKLLERANQARPWTYSAHLVMTSLIASEIYDKVFCSDQPWDLVANLEKSLGDKGRFFEMAMEDRGYQWRDLLNHSSYKMMNDEKFQETEVAEHAKSLAANFGMVISAHLQMIRHNQRPDDAERPVLAVGSNMRWVEWLERIFHTALILKGKIATYPECHYNFTWPATDAMLDQKNELPMHKKLSFDQKIMLTVWPGIMATTVPKWGEAAEIYCATRARVSTTSVE